MKNQRKYDWGSNRNIAAVMHDFRLGKEHAFEVVFKELYKTMFYFCDNIIDNDQEAEDICLIAFQGLFQRCSEFDGEGNIMAFLTVSIRHRCASYAIAKGRHRRKHQEAYIEDIDTSLLDKHKGSEMRDKMIAAMKDVPAESLKVLNMLVYDEMDSAEIAEKLNISINTVNSHKHIALNHIKWNLQLTEMNRRQRIFNKYNGLCAYTGNPLGDDWQIDHMEPYFHCQMRGENPNRDENLMPSLRIVNHYKRSYGLEEFRGYMLSFHKRLKKLPKNPHTTDSIKHKEYLLKVSEVFGITVDNPFSGKFFFEKQ